MSKFSNDNPIKKFACIPSYHCWYSFHRLINESEDIDFDVDFPVEYDPKIDNLCYKIPEEVNNKTKEERQCVYIIVINGLVFKIGKADTGIINRMSGYKGPGPKSDREKEVKNTNYWVFNSLKNIFIDQASKGVEVRFHVQHLAPKIPVTFLGKKYVVPILSPKFIEDALIEKFKENQEHLGNDDLTPIGN